MDQLQVIGAVEMKNEKSQIQGKSDMKVEEIIKWCQDSFGNFNGFNNCSMSIFFVIEK